MKEFFLQKELSSRKEKSLLRSLLPENNLVDFSSDDYLGFSQSKELFSTIEAEMQRNKSASIGSTGSRLLTGNSNYAEALESYIATYHRAQAGLMFNSGYTANIGLLSSVPQKEDVIFYDELSHASIYDGIRLSKAQSFPFKHNDIRHLEERLMYFNQSKKEAGNCFVVIESVYSMDGDFAPLKELVSLSEKYNASLIVDEAHASGLFGENGEGRVVEEKFQDKVFARVHTFGKALGCHGAMVLGSKTLRDYLINFSRPFIYTTALPFHDLAAIKCAYEFLKVNNNTILKIRELVSLFSSLIEKNKDIVTVTKSSSPIQSILMAGNEAASVYAEGIRKDGFDVRAILSPTVPKGKERIRICLHAFNTPEQVEQLFISLNKNKDRFAQRETFTL